jgi:uncharacterized protein with NAD-binding domain and iron-sulfur cluster
MAGVAAARELGRAGLAACVLVARDRLGGRVFTAHDPACAAPIELGTEFIHGCPREIWDPLEKAKVEVSEVDGDNWCVTGDRLSTCDFPSAVDAILGKMDDALPDESFPAFLERRCGNPKNEKQRQTRPPGTRGKYGTVHAAIASGYRAAQEILQGID